MSGLPPLTEIEDANWDYLTTNAIAWTNLANTWEAAFTEVRDASKSPGGTPWTGAGAEAFQQRAAADVVKIHGPADMLRNAAAIATRGAQAQQSNKGLVLSAVNTAEREDFRVGDDYSVTDTRSYYSSAAEQVQRETAAERHSSFIKSRAANLVNNEQEIARQLNTATAGLHGFAFPEDGADGGAGGNGQPRVVLVDDVKRDPTIKGPATTPAHEQNGYDLQDQFQDGKGPIFGGDPRDGVPRSPASQLAQGPPGTRPLPTGTALGPDGHRYAFFSNPDGTVAPGINEFVTNGAVWDYTDPAHPVKVGDLPGIYQASGVYDAATNQMVIVGNTSNRNGDLTRGLWVSGPIDPAQPNSWVNSLQHVGDVGLPGDRESQLIALQGGGYALVGATNGGPVQAISSATPQGLTSATPQTLLSQGQLPTVYGPTVMGTSLDPATGVETIQLRVSTWPPGPIYDPNTWTTTFEVQH
ncbi:hypothetical protein [Mycolicibacter virginiensis]|uniref:hypothetical protein n=1 Tax=Mycolicibacter virginiensis TaxID=1795032 RepID=UPI00256F26F7|nr:hypothetical protein [Mycolicibacter virginiensis]